MSTVVKDLGAVSAYAYAVEKGYTGTEAEFAELMADYAEVGQRAEDAADSALESKTAAQTAATTATNKATEATTAATTATTKAGEASTSASTATSAKDTAVSASQTATTKATEATTAAATATSAATTATTAKDDAVSAKTAAQTAQTGAETAAASVQSSAAQIATNTSDITELKEDLTTLAPKEDMLKAFPTDTASGSVASFADGANVPVKSLVVNIDPVQSGSGGPSLDNVRPISGHTQAVVTRTGVNVWDEQWENGFINDAGQNSALTTAFRSKNYISVIPNTAYFVCCPQSVFVFYYDENKDFITKDTAHGSGGNLRNEAFTIPQNVRYMRFTMYSTPTYNNDISINYPATDHDYHPYSGQSINIQLGQTVYGGKLDVTNGVLTVDRAMVDLGNLEWGYNQNQSAMVSIGIAETVGDGLSIICDRYETINDLRSGILAPLNKVIGVNKDGTHTTGDFAAGALVVKDTDYTNATAFANAMTGAQLCYEVATPLTIQLTPHEVTALLGSNNVWADSGDSTVEYRADPTLYINKKIAEAISALS